MSNQTLRIPVEYITLTVGDRIVGRSGHVLIVTGFGQKVTFGADNRPTPADIIYAERTDDRHVGEPTWLWASNVVSVVTTAGVSHFG